MYYVVHGRMNENEVLLLRRFITSAGLLPFAIYDINGKLPPAINNEVVIAVYDETKAKSVFQKKLETTVFNDRITVRLDRPATFMLSKESADATFKQLTDLAVKYGRVKRIKSSITQAFLNVDELLNAYEIRKVFMFEDINGHIIEVRPPDIEPTIIGASLTYDEFLFLYIAQGFLELEKVTIYGGSKDGHQ